MITLIQNELKIQDFIKPGTRAYFIGIGGVGMSGLAKVLKDRGLQVSGSDQRESCETRELAKMGIPVYIGHDSTHVDGQDIVIYSSAVSLSSSSSWL